MVPNKINTLDLFSGCGGSSWGAKRAGVKLSAALDSWQLACQNYKENFKKVQLFNDRIENVDPRIIEDSVGKIELIIASPECTSHTCARGSNPRSEGSRMTAFEVTRFAKVLKPRWIVIENVVHMRTWSRYSEMIGILNEDLGYRVCEQVIDSSTLGVPQSRRRLFITCDLKKEPSRVQTDCCEKVPASSIIQAGQYSFSPLLTEKRAKATLERANRAISNVGKQTPFLIVYYGSDAAGGWQPVNRPLRTITTLDRFAYVVPDKTGYKMRMLQVPEIKAAMGFPPQFKLPHGTRRDKIHLLGNAVCPPVMEKVIRSLVW